MSLTRSITRKTARSIFRSIVGDSVGSSGTAFDPTIFARQSFLFDAPYYDANSPLGGLQVLRSLEPYDSYRAPRQFRHWTFNGTTGYGTRGARLTTGSPTTLTFGGWFKWTGTGSYSLMGEYSTSAGNHRSWWVLQSSAAPGRIAVVVSADGGTINNKSYIGNTTGLNDGNWHHIVGVFGSGTLTIYVDGVLQVPTKSTDGTVASIFNSTSYFSIGTYDTNISPNLFFPGSAMDVRVYTSAFSAGDISAWYAGDYAAPNTTNLISGYWCNEESGTTGYDWYGSNNLTLVGGVTHGTGTGRAFNPANILGHTYANNLVKYSEQFDNAIWVKTNLTVSANIEGTADSLLETTANNLHYCTQTTAHATGSCTFRVDMKPNGRQYVHLNINNGSGGAGAIFNLSGAGAVVGYTSINTGVTITTSTIELLGDGYYKCTVSCVVSSGSPYAELVLRNSDSTSWILTYIGDVTKGVYCRYAQLESGALSTAYTKTEDTVFNRVIIPRKEATPTLDALGGTLQYTGECPYPANVETPCGTFDGVDDYVSVADVAALRPGTGVFSVACWIFLPDSSVNKKIYAKQNGTTFDGFALLQTNDWFTGGNGKKIAFGVGSSSLTNIRAYNTTNNIADGNWHHIVAVSSGSTIKIYVDAIDQPLTASSLVGSWPNVNGTERLVIGNGPNFNQSLACNLLDIRHYSKAITADEAVFLKTGGGSGTDPTAANLVAYWPICEGQGTTVHDVSGNANHGTVTNATTTAGAGFWANRCNTVQDHCIKYGGKIGGSSQFIPALLDSSLCADGSALTIQPGKAYNPYSRINFNPWTAAELNGRNIPTAFQPSIDNLDSVLPADSAFFRAGDSHFLITREALTGNDLAAAEAYYYYFTYNLVDDSGNQLIDDLSNNLITEI